MGQCVKWRSSALAAAAILQIIRTEILWPVNCQNFGGLIIVMTIRRKGLRSMRRRYVLALLPAIAVIAAASVNGTVTYYKDVLPILQDRCQGCHRPNQLAPNSFLTYRETRPWAEAIKQVVAARKMPPAWSEEVATAPPISHSGLTPREIYMIVTWVEQGAVEGDPHDAPPPLYFEQTRLLQPNRGCSEPDSGSLVVSTLQDSL
jgi:hypothetical protein